MKKNTLLSTVSSAKYMAKRGLAIILALGLFSAGVNAQDRKDEGRNNRAVQARPQERRQQSRPTEVKPKQQRPQARPAPARPKNISPNRTVNTRQRTTVLRQNPNYKRPVYNAHNPSWRYANVPKRNTVITVVPSGYRTVNYGGYAYRYNRGVFYRPYNNSFIVVAPPIGIYINVMPVGYRRIMVNNYPYYYYNGSYYQYRNNLYYVVSPPEGAIVESLPAGYQTLTIDGETYYTIDGAQYKPVIQDNGEIWYQVIKAN